MRSVSKNRLVKNYLSQMSINLTLSGGAADTNLSSVSNDSVTYAERGSFSTLARGTSLLHRLSASPVDSSDINSTPGV
jgi:hypothetical protein